VVVYGREPIAGRVKTRLADAVGEQKAADVYGELLDHTLHQASESGLQAILSLSSTPSEDWAQSIRLPWETQCEGDLGERLAATFELRFSEGRSHVVVIGSDCPGITANHIRSAIDALKEYPIVLGPAEDGGYWLVGQRSPGVDLFSGIPWSTPCALEETRKRLRGMAVAWTELDPLADVDTLADLERALVSSDVDANVRTRLGRFAEPGKGTS
jgi:rSAM/selenodomain-associated transferase 1